jgi:phenylacetate-CoA ligase
MLSNWKAFQRTAFRWKVHAFRRRAEAVLAEMIDNDRLSLDTREARMRAKRRALVLHAFENSAFYKQLYESRGLTRVEAADPDSFTRLPIVSRADIVRNFESIKSRGVPRRFLVPATTGGSTGTPLTVLHDTRFPADAIAWRVAQWWGVHPADDMGVVYRIRRKFPASVVNQITWWPSRRIYLDASRMTKASMNRFSRNFNKLKPPLLIGYVGAILEFAEFLRRNSIELHPPTAVWVTSGPFTEAQRQLMQTVFKAPVYDQYGTCEVLWLAAECRQHNGLHIMQDYRHIEFVDDEDKPVGDGEWGRVLVTDLENRGFPLIRYDIGDIGRRLPGSCPCGITLPRIDKIKGRTSDTIRTPDGGSVSGDYLTTVFDAHPDAVSAFQVYQGRDLAVTLRCVPTQDPAAPRHIEDARRAIQDRVGGSVKVSIELIDRIPHDRGKTRFIISDAPKS